MSSANVINPVAYIRTSREFPPDLEELGREMNRGWIEIANATNNRTIGMFPTNKPAQTGESWFLNTNQKQQTLRQTYMFTATTSINHGITVTDPDQFTRCFGSYTDGTNSYGLIWGTTIAVAGLITFYQTSSQIIFVIGAGAPALISGRITLEYLSAP
jgi:hypothetical protein